MRCGTGCSLSRSVKRQKPETSQKTTRIVALTPRNSGAGPGTPGQTPANFRLIWPLTWRDSGDLQTSRRRANGGGVPLLVSSKSVPAPPDGYRTIGDVADELGITLRALRFYEQKDLIRPTRHGSWTRKYRQIDVDRLRLILRLRSAGIGLADIAELLKHSQGAIAPSVRLAPILRQRLDAIQDDRMRLDEEERVAREMLCETETPV
jgi:DNA-binding transcriptional MerR regulator